MGINQTIAVTDGDKVKIECKDGKMIKTVNDVVSSPVSVTETNVGIRFQMMGESSVTFKNFKVYPI